MTAPSRATTARWKPRTIARGDGTAVVRKQECRRKFESRTPETPTRNETLELSVQESLERESREWARVIQMSSDWTHRESVATLKVPRSSQLTYNATCKRQELHVMVDSGATLNCISAITAERLRSKLRPVRREFDIAQADRSTFPVYNFVIETIRIGKLSVRAVFYVTPMDYDMILGTPFLQRYRPVLDWRGGVMQVRYNGVVCHIQPAARPLREPEHLIKALTSPEEAINLIRREPKTMDVPQQRPCSDAPTGNQYYLAILETGEMDDDFVHGSAKPQEEWPPREVPPEIADVLREFADVFPAKLPVGLPPEREVDHRIEIDETVPPPVAKGYRMSPKEEQELQRQLRELLDLGHIERANSPFAAAVLFAKKKDGTLRLCVDYRALNAITRKDKYPLPRIDEQIDNMRESTVFSKLDLTSGYHQLRVAREHVQRTAFVTRFGTYQFRVMPFGLTNAPATFQRLMNLLFANHLATFVKIYLDDIVLHSRTMEDHVKHLRTALTILRENKLYCKPPKCTFAQTEIPFCGFMVGRDGIRPMPEKIDVLKTWPRPKDVHGIRRFLGFVGFYQKFVRSYANMAIPLTNLLAKDTPFTWGEAQQNAFDRIRDALVKATLLTSPQLMVSGSSTRFVGARNSTGANSLLVRAAR